MPCSSRGGSILQALESPTALQSRCGREVSRSANGCTGLVINQCHRFRVQLGRIGTLAARDKDTERGGQM